MPEDTEQKAGYVYVLVNSALPGLVKIGITKGRSKARAHDLSSNTSIPTPFVVAYDELVADCAAVEKRLHERFAQCRENSRREFFRLEAREAIDALQKAARFSPFIDDNEAVRINLLPAFESRFRRWLRRDLVGIAYIQTSSVCALEEAYQKEFSCNDVTVERIDLDFIRGPGFSCEREPEENAKMVVEFDSYSLVNCFNFIDDEVVQWILREEEMYGETPFSVNSLR